MGTWAGDNKTRRHGVKNEYVLNDCIVNRKMHDQYEKLLWRWYSNTEGINRDWNESNYMKKEGRNWEGRGRPKMSFDGAEEILIKCRKVRSLKNKRKCIERDCLFHSVLGKKVAYSKKLIV